jgi:hypothetical protein
MKLFQALRSRATRRLAGVLLVLPVVLALMAPGAALAHERREVGPYTFVVGFINEPAWQGHLNGIDLRVTRTATGEPVTGVEQTLKASIQHGGGQPREFPLRTRFNMPGAYTADVIPTQAGTYIFTFAGTIEGNQVNQRFESGPGRFNNVETTDRLQFPVAIPAGATLAGSVQEAEARAAAAEARASQAQAFGTGGIVLGILGVVLGGGSLLASRRNNGSVAQPAVGGARTAGA